MIVWPHLHHVPAPRTIPQVDYKFMVHHYAGNIVYHTEGFLEKNRDMLHQEGIDLLKSSTSEFIRSFGDRCVRH